VRLIYLLLPLLLGACPVPSAAPRPGNGWWLADEPTCDWVQVRCERVTAGKAMRLATTCPATAPAVAYTPKDDELMRMDLARASYLVPHLQQELELSRSSCDSIVKSLRDSLAASTSEMEQVHRQLLMVGVAHEREIKDLDRKNAEARIDLIKTSVSAGVLACALTALITVVVTD